MGLKVFLLSKGVRENVRFRFCSLRIPLPSLSTHNEFPTDWKWVNSLYLAVCLIVYGQRAVYDRCLVRFDSDHSPQHAGYTDHECSAPGT